MVPEQEQSQALKRRVTEKLGRKATHSLVFALVNEIRRLSKSTTLPFRVTAYVQGLSADALITEHHNGMEHVFDKQTYQRFKRLLDDGDGRFTVFIYETLVAFCKSHTELIEQTDVDANAHISVVDISEPIYRKEERMHLGYKVNIHAYDSDKKPSEVHPEKIKGNIVAVGVTQNISQNGVRIKASSPPKKGAYYIVHITDINKEFVMSQPYVIYECKGVERALRDGQLVYYWSMMKVSHPAHAEFDGFLKTFIFANRTRYRVDLMNVERASTNHIVEQFLTNRSKSFSVFYNENWAPLCIYGTGHSTPFVQSLKTDKGRDVVMDLIEKDGIDALGNGKTVLWFGVKRRSGFYTTCLDPDEPMTWKYLKFVLRNEDGFVYHVHSRAVDGGTPFIKQSIPDSVKSKRPKLRANDHYSDSTQALVGKIRHAIQFTPLPRETLSCLLPADYVAEGDPRFNQLLLSAVKVRKVPFIKARQNELRKEDRFTVSMPCDVSSSRERFGGQVNDLSIQGAAISLNGAPPAFTKGERVAVTYHDIKVDDASLRVRYEVAHADHEKGVIRLRQEEDEHSQASHAIESYLVRNLGTILPQQSSENRILPDKYSGLDRALRNLHNQHGGVSEGVVSIRKGMGYVTHINIKPSLLSLVSDAKPQEEMQVTDPESLKAFFFQPDIKRLIAEGLKESTVDSPYSYRLAFFQYDGNGVYSVRGVKPDEMALPIWRMQSKEAKRAGRSLRVMMMRVTRKSRIFDYYYRDELNYVEAISPHRAEKLKELVKGTLGVVSFHPVPHSVIQALTS